MSTLSTYSSSYLSSSSPLPLSSSPSSNPTGTTSSVLGASTLLSSLSTTATEATTAASQSPPSSLSLSLSSSSAAPTAHLAPPLQQVSSGMSTGAKVGMGVGIAIGFIAFSLLGGFVIVIFLIPSKRRRALRRASIHDSDSRQVESAFHDQESSQHEAEGATNQNVVVSLADLLAENQRLRQLYLNERHEMEGDRRIHAELSAERAEMAERGIRGRSWWTQGLRVFRGDGP